MNHAGFLLKETQIGDHSMVVRVYKYLKKEFFFPCLDAADATMHGTTHAWI